MHSESLQKIHSLDWTKNCWSRCKTWKNHTKNHPKKMSYIVLIFSQQKSARGQHDKKISATKSKNQKSSIKNVRLFNGNQHVLHCAINFFNPQACICSCETACKNPTVLMKILWKNWSRKMIQKSIQKLDIKIIKISWFFLQKFHRKSKIKFLSKFYWICFILCDENKNLLIY